MTPEALAAMLAHLRSRTEMWFVLSGEVPESRPDKVCIAAADEIERLRAVLEKAEEERDEALKHIRDDDTCQRDHWEPRLNLRMRERDTAEARAARYRELLSECHELMVRPAHVFSCEAYWPAMGEPLYRVGGKCTCGVDAASVRATAALSDSDDGRWLAEHDQQVRRKALEEAARICDANANDITHLDDQKLPGASRIAREDAKRIRSLAAQPPGETKP